MQSQVNKIMRRFSVIKRTGSFHLLSYHLDAHMLLESTHFARV